MAAPSPLWRLGEALFGKHLCPEPEYLRVADRLEHAARLIRSGRYVPLMVYTTFIGDGQFGKGSIEADVTLVPRNRPDD